MTAAGKAAVRRIAAVTPPAEERYTLKAIDMRRRTVKLVSAARKVTLDSVPLAKDVEVVGYKAEMINGGVAGGGAGVIAVGPAKPQAARLEDLRPEMAVSVEVGFEGGRVVVRKVAFDMK